ncbi:MAG: archease [Desulfobacterales bacterium]|nr:archease [Desulfobacterales bacterium]
MDHTADFGIEVWAGDAGELFSGAAEALFDLIVDRGELRSETTRSLVIVGADWTDLLVNWLRELLYLWNGEQLLVCRTVVDPICPKGLRATVVVDRFDPGRHHIENKVKAVTYHLARVEVASGKWTARFIVDV